MKKISPFKTFKINWPILVLITGVFGFGFASLGNLVASPKTINRLEIFLGSDKLTIDKLEDKINKNKTDQIYEVNITAYNEGTSLFNSYFTSAAIATDIIIVSNDIVKEENMKALSDYVSSIDKNYLEETLEVSELTYLGAEGKNYAFKVYDSASKTGLFKDIIDYKNKDQYLMFGKSSIHIGKNNGSNSTEALKLLRNLFNEK